MFDRTVLWRLGLAACVFTGGCGRPAAVDDPANRENSPSPAAGGPGTRPVTGASGTRQESAASAPRNAALDDDLSESTQPFGGNPQPIPGLIEAENYDKGAAGVAYHDVEEENLGADDHRSTTQVDIEKRDDASGGYGIGWTRQGEWVIYTVDVQESGTYSLEVPVASNQQGGTFHLEFDGQDVTGPIAVPDTGGWGTLQTITHHDIKLSEGVQKMRLVMDEQGPSGSIGDIDCLRFERVE